MTPTNTTSAPSATLARVAALYADNLRLHGESSKSVGWKDEPGQVLRFDQLLTAVLPHDWTEGFTVNDLGTGYGALHDRLAARGAHVTGFTGYDISSEMLGRARARLPAATRLIEADRATQPADYGFASGIFNVRFDADADEWCSYMERTIRNLAETSRKGFAFNALSTYVDWKDRQLFYADPLHFFDFCKREVSRYVTLLHDTPLYEWTMVVRKEDAP